jgi:hypothetical protein
MMASQRLEQVNSVPFRPTAYAVLPGREDDIELLACRILQQAKAQHIVPGATGWCGRNCPQSSRPMVGRDGLEGLRKFADIMQGHQKSERVARDRARYWSGQQHCHGRHIQAVRDDGVHRGHATEFWVSLAPKRDPR